MRAAVYYSNHDIRIEEMPVPGIGPGEILVRIESSGICGSDVMEWYRRPRAPLVLGHEIAGVVEKIGDGDSRFAPGDRVAVSHHVPCNECRYCRRGQHSLCDTLRSTGFDPGGFAEFVRVPSINVETGTFIIPGGLPFDAAAFIEPLACVVRGLRAASARAGGSALVLGSGISGLLFVKLLRASGASRVVTTDPVPARREAALRMGADAALEPDKAAPERLHGLGGGRLFDLAIVCAGAVPVVDQALRSVDRGGTVLLFAPLEPGTVVPVRIFDLWRDQVTIVSTYAGCPEDIARSIDLLDSGAVEVDDMITHRLPLDRAGEGFRLTAEG
ncbi:MAG: alcohol dehydrogenase catalytic domain-containing protein, partial [Candidatus Krumholzibacteria bacterium]|nr:alcohol dehydrogenase catalytic domain-containing protein [Candidatus Krumholzibacteria bacterium]